MFIYFALFLSTFIKTYPHLTDVVSEIILIFIASIPNYTVSILTKPLGVQDAKV